MKLKDFINDFKKKHKALTDIAEKVLYKEEPKILAKLIAHSPYDSGYFASRWRVRRLRFTSSRTLAGLVISNDTPGYGQFAASGAQPQQAPWYYPHRHRSGKRKGQMKKGTGKLKMTPIDGQGRVWAGGLNPGHDKTVGGVMENALKSAGFDGKFTSDLSDEFVKGFT